MSMLMIYTPQNGEYLKTVLDAMATLCNTATFKSAMDIVMILAVCMTGYQYVCGKKLESLGRYVLTSFCVLYVLIGIKVNVAIIDMQEAGSAGHALTVDNVPIGNALPAAIISGIGYGITQAFSDVFHMPDDMDYNKSGMIFGARTWLSATSAQLSRSPDVSRDLSSYIRQCVFSAKLLGSQQISASELTGSADLVELYFKSPSPVYRVVMHDGQNLSCIDAAKILKEQLTPAAQKEMEHLSRIMTKGDKNKFETSLTGAHQYFMGVTKNAANILTQNILINATRNAAADAYAFAGADAELMNYTNSSSLQKMHIAEANTFWLASFRLPYYMTVMWMMTICIFPLVALMALFPTTHNVYRFYLQSQAYLWSWPPMFIIIHFFVSLASSKTMDIFGRADGGVTFSTIDAVTNLHSNFAYTAGALAASVPFLAYYITKGLSSVLSSASQHFGGMAQSLSVSEAQSAAQGNVSMASYSGWNMNYENTNANKFDTNYHHAEGRATAQAGNGALISQGMDGSRTVNAQPAISQMATKLHGSDRIVSSLQESAGQSFHNAETHRTAADSHIQQALSGLSQFSATDANDTREGVGVSKTLSNSLNQDIRQMQDAINQYNLHHDKSSQVNFDKAMGAKVHAGQNGLVSVFGKMVGVGWSGELSTGKRWSTGETDNVQAFFNSSEGQSFSKAFNHMEATAKNHHLDATDSLNLSKSEQIASNLTQGHALSQMASSEFSQGENYQHMANEAREHASSIDTTLDQAFYNWVAENKGAAGEHALMGADAQSLHAQKILADEFMNSNAGRSAVQDQVHSLIGNGSADIKDHHEKNQAQMVSANRPMIENVHQSGKDQVQKKADYYHLNMLSDRALGQGTDLKMEAAKENLPHVYQAQEKGTREALIQKQGALAENHALRKKNFEDEKKD